MKRKIVVILTLAILLCAILATGASAVTATATPSNILINGQAVSFDSYLINGNNYLKLRDLAYSLTGTGAQFNVGWDGSSILLTSDSAYAPKGGEMSKKGTGVSNATLSSSAILKDGVKIPMVAYNIDGSNYFKLRDLAQILDFSVEWNANTNSIAIDSDKSYVMPSSSSLGVNSYPLLFTGMTKAEIDAKLGAPTLFEDGCTMYSNGLWFGFDTANEFDAPTDSNRCIGAGGYLKNIINGCPSSLTVAQLRSLFGSADIIYESKDAYISINYGGSQLEIRNVNNGTVTPESVFYFYSDKAYSKPADDINAIYKSFFNSNYSSNAQTFFADLTHDGKNEMIVIYREDTYAYIDVVTVDDNKQGKVIYSDSSDTNYNYHYYYRLYKNNDQAYLVRSNEGMRQGAFWYSYWVYSLSGEGKQIYLAKKELNGSYGAGGKMVGVTQVEIDQFNKELNSYINKSSSLIDFVNDDMQIAKGENFTF